MHALYGTPMWEAQMKRGLLRCNSEIAFDLPTRHGLWHPNIERWQNIRWREQHIGSMGRECIPEADSFLIDPRTKRVIRMWQVGWRTSLEAIAKHGITGLQWPDFCLEFGIDRKPPPHPVFIDAVDGDPISEYRAAQLSGV